jgi:hypothetical protein
MPELIFKLRNVPDDEADDIKDLLRDNGYEFYETSAGRWGISMPAIWLHDGQNVVTAKMLINDYQQKRYASARAEYDAKLRAGEVETFMQRLLSRPVRSAGLILLILFVVLLMALPVFIL